MTLGFAGSIFNSVIFEEPLDAWGFYYLKIGIGIVLVFF